MRSYIVMAYVARTLGLGPTDMLEVVVVGSV